jgi:regulator of CtrA degradation
MSPFPAFEQDEAAPISFGQTFVTSERFKALFRDGMFLVEETADYLDGPGREESRNLHRSVALTYASESMRLTTRLMQIASWLLVQRAVAEGEITPDQALQEKNRVRLGVQEGTVPEAEFEVLPDHLKNLIMQTNRLHARILHLDQLITTDAPAMHLSLESPVAIQHWLIESHFSAALQR